MIHLLQPFDDLRPRELLGSEEHVGGGALFEDVQASRVSWTRCVELITTASGAFPPFVCSTMEVRWSRCSATRGETTSVGRSCSTTGTW
jgi:hypothetical protein